MKEEPMFPLTALSEVQRAQALERYTIIHPALEDGVSQAQIARTYELSPSTIQRWLKQYREKGLVGLANQVTRSDKGKARSVPEQAVQLIEGLALQTPPRSAASIHRKIVSIATEQGWKPPSYARVRQIIKNLSPALVTLAHQGSAAYREEFDLLYRREATHANAMWQADHTPLDVWVFNEEGKPAQPWLTVIEDDYSRAIAGYRLSIQEPTALTTALTLRTAIWRKEDPSWHVCGIPSTFYTDHGSDFTSTHMEQVAVDLHMELIFSQVGIPRGRGKIERFFRSVNQLFLQDIPGYAPKGYTAKVMLTFAAFEQRFRNWLLTDYHHHVHSETHSVPQERWEASGFLPRMPDSLEQLDLLLLTVAKTRRVQQDGIHFQSHRYLDPTLAAYVKEDVLIRYDPADMAEIRVFYQDRFLCRAICQELSGQTVSFKEIEKARNKRRKQVKDGLTTRTTIVEQFLAVHREDAPSPQPSLPEPVAPGTRLRLEAGISMSDPSSDVPQMKTLAFVSTKEYRLFSEFCDACRKYRYIGLCHGVPGAGKTRSAREYASWDRIEPLLPEQLFTLVGRSHLDGNFPHKPFASLASPVLPCRTVLYTAPVAASPGCIEREVMSLNASLSYLVEAAEQASRGKDDFLLAYRLPERTELVIVDEADRLKMTGLEQLRDLYDRGRFGLVLIGMPGLEKRLARYPQLYSRVGFVHQFRVLSEEETRHLLQQRWSHLGMHGRVEDFTDQEAINTIIRITGGNFRVIHRLLMQVERILESNQLQTVTKEVVEAAREGLVLGQA